MNATFDNNDTVTAGETLNGLLAIEVSKMVKCSSVTIHLHGKEHTGVARWAGKNRQTRSEKSVFLDISIPVLNHDRIVCNGRIKPGNYAVPFSVCLPPGSPATVKVSGHEDHASITYTLSAVFLGSGILEDYQTKREVCVLAEPEQLTGTFPTLLSPTAKGITKNGFSHKGSMYCGAQISQSRYSKGQQPKIRVCVINDSAAKLHRIDVHVEQMAEWRARDWSSQRSFALAKTSCVVPEGYADKLDEKTRIQRANNKDRKANNTTEIERLLGQKGGLSFSLSPVPHSAWETQSTSRIKISHSIVITLATEGSKSNPTFHIPIRIVRNTPVVEANATRNTVDDSSVPVVTATEVPIATAAPTSARQYVTAAPSRPAQTGFNLGALSLF